MTTFACFSALIIVSTALLVWAVWNTPPDVELPQDWREMYDREGRAK